MGRGATLCNSSESWVCLSLWMMISMEELPHIRSIDDVLSHPQPAQAQIDHLQHLGVAPLADELALEFHDLYLLVPQLAAQRVLTHQQRKAVDAVSRKLDDMSTCQ